MSALADASGLQRGIFTVAGEGGVLPLLSCDQCSTSEAGWLAAGHTAVGLLWTGEHGEPAEKTLYKVVYVDASVCICV